MIGRKFFTHHITTFEQRGIEMSQPCNIVSMSNQLEKLEAAKAA